MSEFKNSFTGKPSRIIGIQFSVMSPEEIVRNSVLEIQTRDTYVNNNTPVLNGLFDPRMNTQEANQFCPTDGHDYFSCPGFFGHIKLARPVFYWQFYKEVYKILRCICFKCSKLLIDKNKYHYLLKHQPETRWSEVYALASKIKRCGEDTEDGCSCKQPTKIKKVDLAVLIAEWDTKSSNTVDDEDEQTGGADVQGDDDSVAVTVDEAASMSGQTTQTNKITMKITAEIVLKIFKRISNDDVYFMGFNPVWTRPEWFICEVVAVAPPNVRPSVKHDTHTRAEDDMTIILMYIFKFNEKIKSLIAQNAEERMIEHHVSLLQYYVATLIDNKIPGSSFAPIIQRSGRPMKSLKDRLNGKSGRVRQNLMGKRVDFSARSVITADPNISIAELGVPLQIAKNITRPVRVNQKNREFLLGLVRNGPDNYPGAKMIDCHERKITISLSYKDLNSIELNEGDIVHRHMLDGDFVLFNRQPTLHRMSMMAHRARIMHHGNSFRMNVAVTQPYNADFDGDEMNLHMPQDDMSEIELRELAAIPHNIISPGMSKPIIGIFQDSLVGCTSFTRQNIRFDAKRAMNLLAKRSYVDLDIFKSLSGDGSLSNFDVLTQIMPPITLKYKTDAYKAYESEPERAEANGWLEIVNGYYKRGQLVKGSLASASNGILHRIYQNCGKGTCVQFIDDLQYVINEYMKISGYSVGISDLIWNESTQKQVEDVIAENKERVNAIIGETHLGVFKNDRSMSNYDYLEEKILRVLNETTHSTGKIAQNTLGIENRFVFMSDHLADSKGKSTNLAQMVACLGQQSIYNSRVPYGYDNRSLPHFKKYDDSAEARGFIENSFIHGLNPSELFFHAISGRIGLIDTAVKTSETGYIQRRLIKAMEDIKIEYDMTVRNHKKKIVQFVYGGDSIDTMALESQQIEFMKMSIEQIYGHFYFTDSKNDKNLLKEIFTPDSYTRMRKQAKSYKIEMDEIVQSIIGERKNIAHNVMQDLFNDMQISTKSPVHFKHSISFIINQAGINANTIVDITPLEIMEKLRVCYKKIDRGSEYSYLPSNELFRLLFFHYLSPKALILKYHMNALTLDILLDYILLTYKKAIIPPGEMVGIISAQSVGEPTTQETLNTFHNAGVASKTKVTTGLPRIQEILKITESPARPTMEIFLHKADESDTEAATKMIRELEHVVLKDVVDNVSIYYDPNIQNTVIEEDKLLVRQFNEFSNMVAECANTDLGGDTTDESNRWIFRIKMNVDKMLEKNITMDDIYFVLKNGYDDYVSCIYSDYNASNLVFRLRINIVALRGKKKTKNIPLNVSDEINLLRVFENTLLSNTVIKGVNKISSVVARVIRDSLDYNDGKYSQKEIWVLDTTGTNLQAILALDTIDNTRTITNDIYEIKRVLGIEAARQVIMNELQAAFQKPPEYHHMSLLVDRMTYNTGFVQIYRHGINNDNIGPIAKASFEETPQNFIDAAVYGMLDEMRGISSNVMCGQEGICGTNMFEIIMNLSMLSNVESKTVEEENDVDKEILMEFSNLEFEKAQDGSCSKKMLAMETNFNQFLKQDIVEDDDYEIEL